VICRVRAPSRVATSSAAVSSTSTSRKTPLFDARFEDVDDGAAEQPITPDELFADRLVERPLRAEFEESDVERLAVDRLGLENEPPDKSRERAALPGDRPRAAIRRRRVTH